MSTMTFKSTYCNCSWATKPVVNPNLSFVEAPFSKEEIDTIIKVLPLNQSLGRDGFNIDFIRKYWPIIKQDF